MSAPASPPAHLVDCTFCGARRLPVPYLAPSVQCGFCSAVIPINQSYWQTVAAPSSPTLPYPQDPVFSEPGVSDLERAQIAHAIQQSLQESQTPPRRPPSVTDDDLELALVLSLTEQEQNGGGAGTSSAPTPAIPRPSTTSNPPIETHPVRADVAIPRPTSPHGKGPAEESKETLLSPRRKKTVEEVTQQLQQELQIDGGKATGSSLGYPVLPTVGKPAPQDTATSQQPAAPVQAQLSTPQLPSEPTGTSATSTAGAIHYPSLDTPGISPQPATIHYPNVDTSGSLLQAPAVPSPETATPPVTGSNTGTTPRPPERNNNGWNYPAVNPYGRP